MNGEVLRAMAHLEMALADLSDLHKFILMSLGLIAEGLNSFAEVSVRYTKKILLVRCMLVFLNFCKSLVSARFFGVCAW